MGFAFDAVADDEDTAKVVTVDVSAYKLAAFAMGTAMAGVAGGLYTYFARFLMPDDFGFITSITVLSMVAVGGIGSVFGVIMATIILTLMPEFFRFISDYKLLGLWRTSFCSHAVCTRRLSRVGSEACIRAHEAEDPVPKMRLT